jgi:diacylglycerol kinase (ATP)
VNQSQQTVQESPYKGKTGVRRILNATGYSFSGLAEAWRCEAAFRQLLLLALAGITLAICLPLPGWGRALVVVCHLLSLMVELLNSAIEAAVDHTSLARHQLAKRAKDMGSAAQFVSLCNIVGVWLLVLLSR